MPFLNRRRSAGIRAVFLFALLSWGVVATAAPLSKLVLSVSSDQVVGQPFQTSAEIFLLDSTNAFVTNYNLSTQPITLTPASGLLTPSVLSDTTLFGGGIVNFLPSGVFYSGLSGKVPIQASSDSISSDAVIVSFSGYDILRVFDFKGDPLTQVYQGLPTAIRASVRNGGSLLASTNPSLRTYFTSGGGSIKVFFPPHRDGVIDTVTIIDTATANPGPDTLVMELDSRYTIGTNNYQVISRAKIPVTVLTPASIAFVDNSFKPDSAYAGTSFPLSFGIATLGFSGTIDSASTLIQLTPNGSSTPVATVYNGSPTFSSYQNDTILYLGLGGRLDPTLSITPGWYRIKMSYRLISGSSVFSLTDFSPDSLYVLPQNGPSYVAGSLFPGHVAAGAETSFQFKLTVNNGGLEIEPGTATFSLAGTGFAATVNLIIPDNHLSGGENLLTTENIFIPSNQLNKTLTVSAELHFRLSGAPTYLIYTTDFGGQQINVQQLPVAQILSVDVAAPNAPKVNTNQAFQIVARVSNLSSSPIERLTLRLTSNGTSIDSILKTVTQIPANTTDTILFDVVAADQKNDAEVFSVDIVSTDAVTLPPVDNIALVTIQNPAILALSHTIVGAPGGYLTYGEQFSLVMEITNLYRQGGITPASYHLSTGGVIFDINPEDTLGQISDLSEATFVFHAPSIDTTVKISFIITQAPIDLNTAGPAVLNDTMFQFSVHVISGQATLAVSPAVLRTVPIVVGEQVELFSLHFANGASPGGSAITVNSVALRFFDRLGNLINIRSLFDLSRTGLYFGDQKVSTAFTSDNQLRLQA